MFSTFKNLGFEALVGLVLGFAAGYFIGWWTLPIVTGICSFLFKTPVGRAFAAGTIAGTLLWSGYAGWLNSLNASMLSNRLAETFKAGNGSNLLYATGLAGGLLGGLGAMTGSLLRQFVFPTSEKEATPTA